MMIRADFIWFFVRRVFHFYGCSDVYYSRERKKLPKSLPAVYGQNWLWTGNLSGEKFRRPRYHPTRFFLYDDLAKRIAEGSLDAGAADSFFFGA